MITYGLGNFEGLNTDIYGASIVDGGVNPPPVNNELNELTETVKTTNKLLSTTDKLSVLGFWISLITLAIIIFRNK